MKHNLVPNCIEWYTSISRNLDCQKCLKNHHDIPAVAGIFSGSTLSTDCPLASSTMTSAAWRFDDMAPPPSSICFRFNCQLLAATRCGLRTKARFRLRKPVYTYSSNKAVFLPRVVLSCIRFSLLRRCFHACYRERILRQRAACYQSKRF